MFGAVQIPTMIIGKPLCAVVAINELAFKAPEACSSCLPRTLFNVSAAVPLSKTSTGLI